MILPSLVSEIVLKMSKTPTPVQSPMDENDWVVLFTVRLYEGTLHVNTVYV
jgi:hypothetical protein